MRIIYKLTKFSFFLLLPISVYASPSLEEVLKETSLSLQAPKNCFKGGGYVRTPRAKKIDSFPEREKQLILQFKSTLKKGEIEKARALIKQVQEKISENQLDPEFEVSDLFTTYYFSTRSSPGRWESVLTESCRVGVDAPFYEEMLDLLEANPDVYETRDGRSPLMLLAQYPDLYDKTHQCIKLLLKRGASPTRSNSVEHFTGGGTYSALSYALIGHHVSAINLFLNQIKESGLSLSWQDEELLRAYRGEDFETKVLLGDHRDELFRVANQSLNYALIERLKKGTSVLYEDWPKKKIQDWENHSEVKDLKGTFYYPPLWLYNAVQLRDYAKEVVEKLKPNVIEKSELRPIDSSGNFFTYTHEGKTLTLLRKTIKPLVGRVLAVQHLKGRTYYELPQKFITAPEGGLDKAKVVLTFPTENLMGAISHPVLETPKGINLINVEIEGIELYVEYIEGQSVSVRPHAGFLDGATGNGIRRESDGKIFIIDTGDDKNFIVPVGNSHTGYRAKSKHFSPHIRQVVIDLSM